MTIKHLEVNVKLGRFEGYQNGRGPVQSALKSTACGGSIFTPIGGANLGIGGMSEKPFDNGPIQKPNNLKV